MDQRMKNDLDNYITGHYGEDQFPSKLWNLKCPDCGTWFVEFSDYEEHDCVSTFQDRLNEEIGP